MAKRVDMTAGGHGGSYGRAFVYCQEFGIGKGIASKKDMYTAVADLLDQIEARTGQEYVLGRLTTKWDDDHQEALITDDRRVAVYPKPKKKDKPKVRKPQWQPEEWGHGWQKGLDL